MPERIHAADGRPEFRKGLLRITVPVELRARIEFGGQLVPIGAITTGNLLPKFRILIRSWQGIVVDLHDSPGRREIRIHPPDHVTLFDVKGMLVAIVLEDPTGEDA